MAISLDDLNKVTLRIVFLPWFRETAADLGITLPPDWNPDDAELERLADRVAEGFRSEEIEE